ncbi:MAG: hypothetical protein ACJASZ_002081 [Yoonia sp.]|jgi:hypothetical protein
MMEDMSALSISELAPQDTQRSDAIRIHLQNLDF